MTLPRYKRDAFTFVSNLGAYTANADFPETYRREGYLLSEHYTDQRSMQLAEEVRRRRKLLISDNGNYSRMKAIAKDFEAKGLALLQQAEDEQERQGQCGLATLQQRQILIEQIAAACQAAGMATDYREVLTKQLSIRPHYTIGAEDLTIPVLMLCHLMHPVFEPQAEAILTHQRNTLTQVQAQQQGTYGELAQLGKTHLFTVLHAYDYDSAYQAAQESQQYQQAGIAISYGGPMHSRRWIDQLRIGGQYIRLPERLPESYLIAQSITQGVVNGHSSNIPIHILGVGTPILVALIGYQLRHSRAVSIDSTAPFKDAFIGKLYGRQSAYLKMDMYRLLAHCLIYDRPFNDPTPFYQQYIQQYPHDWKGLQQVLAVRPQDDCKPLAKRLKERGDLLQQYLPFFTPIHGQLAPGFSQQLRIARAGYNYAILQSLCKHIRRLRPQPTAFKVWMEHQIDRYISLAHPKWAKAVTTAYELTEQYRSV